MTYGRYYIVTFVTQEEPSRSIGTDREDAHEYPQIGHEIFLAIQRPAAEDPDIRTTAPENPTVPLGSDHVSGGPAMEGPGPAVLASVAARGQLSPRQRVVFCAVWYVLPGHEERVQDAVAVALQPSEHDRRRRRRWSIGRTAAVQQSAGHEDTGIGERG